MVLETLTKKLDEVKVLISQKKYERKYEELTKITQALQILNASLDMSLGEVPKNLSLLYDYLMRRLQEVHTSLDLGTLDECKSILAAISEGFTEAYRTEEKDSHRGRC
jgi:flagellar biosynthetic protein FliS